MKKNAAPIIAFIVLLLLMLYLTGYFILVWPDQERFNFADSRSDFPTYRFGTESWAGKVYWPLERIDRKLRPNAWAIKPSGFLFDRRSQEIEKNLGGS